ARFRELKLITDYESIHWVGRQLSPDTICACDLMSPLNVTRSPEWHDLRKLRRNVFALFSEVRLWTGKQTPLHTLAKMNVIGERVAGLTQGLRLELRLPLFPVNQSFRLHGPASIPVILLEDGIILMGDEANVHVWMSHWRVIIMAIDTRLA